MAVTRKGAKRFLFLENLRYIGSSRLLVTAKRARKQQAIATTLQKKLKNCKQATAYISHEVPLLEASGHP